MADFFAKKVATHVLKEGAANKFGTEDPYFDYVTPHDLNGNPTGKPRKQKKAVPPGLTKKEEKVLKKVTRRAYRLDNCINICGIRIGWGAVAGLIPALGDVFDSLCALMVYHTCLAAEIPASLKSRMLLNIMLDFAIGLVPVLGDVADALYRANTRNAGLLYSHLKARGAARIAEDEKSAATRGNHARERSQSRGRGGQAPRKPHDQQQSARSKERMQVPGSSHGRQPSSGSSRKGRNNQQQSAQVPPPQPPRRFITADDLAQPAPAHANQNGQTSRGWFRKLLGDSSGQRQDRDVENLDDIPMR